jgi:hypothetical protein
MRDVIFIGFSVGRSVDRTETIFKAAAETVFFFWITSPETNEPSPMNEPVTRPLQRGGSNSEEAYDTRRTQPTHMPISQRQNFSVMRNAIPTAAVTSIRRTPNVVANPDKE